jgi:prepilin-type N-terminal cleavage/methylation domain-containing protein
MVDAAIELNRGNERRGFTLTELAIVLGIMGVILGAIWAAAAAVYQNNRVKTVVTETAQILEGYRSLYSLKGVDSGDWVDITCMGVTDGFFPASMLPPGATCATNNVGTYPQHPWNSYVQVWSFLDWQGIIIGFFNLAQSNCAQLATQIASVPDIIWEQIDSTQISLLPPAGNSTPWTTTQISNLCVAGNANAFYVMFRAR